MHRNLHSYRSGTNGRRGNFPVTRCQGLQPTEVPQQGEWLADVVIVAKAQKFQRLLYVLDLEQSDIVGSSAGFHDLELNRRIAGHQPDITSRHSEGDFLR